MDMTGACEGCVIDCVLTYTVCLNTAGPARAEQPKVTIPIPMEQLRDMAIRMNQILTKLLVRMHLEPPTAFQRRVDPQCLLLIARGDLHRWS